MPKELWEQVQDIAVYHFQVGHKVCDPSGGGYVRPSGRPAKDVNCPACLELGMKENNRFIRHTSEMILARKNQAKEET